MKNDISLTIRLPITMNEQLTDMTKRLGLTKTSCIRFAIWDFLDKQPQPLTFSKSDEETYRFVLAVNQNTYNILNNACQKYGQSINSIINAVSRLALEHYSKYL